MFTVHGASMPGGAAPWMEAVVAILLNLTILIVVMCLLILRALWQSRRRSRAAEP